MQLTLRHHPAQLTGRRTSLFPRVGRFLEGAGATMAALGNALLALFGFYRH
jgi:hypothetical protein